MKATLCVTRFRVFFLNYHPASRENNLHRHFHVLHLTPQDLIAAVDVETSMVPTKINRPITEYPLFGDHDRLYLQGIHPVGIIELKCFLKVMAQSIDLVLNRESLVRSC